MLSFFNKIYYNVIVDLDKEVRKCQVIIEEIMMMIKQGNIKCKMQKEKRGQIRQDKIQEQQKEWIQLKQVKEKKAKKEKIKKENFHQDIQN